jgi:hypothetical protein
VVHSNLNQTTEKNKRTRQHASDTSGRIEARATEMQVGMLVHRLVHRLVHSLLVPGQAREPVEGATETERRRCGDPRMRELGESRD